MTESRKSLADFQRAHDPTFQLDAVGETYSRNIDWKKTKRAIIVAAQNATPVHREFWAVLQHVAETLSAELLVIPIRYKNATSLWTASQRNAEWWAPEVRPYLWNVRQELNPNFVVLGDIKIQPTTSNPLSGAETLSRACSAVVGHTRAQTISVATPPDKMAKLLMTSGACTQPNYTDTRVGRLGEFHHSLSAIMVEMRGKHFFARRLHYTERTKRIIDLGVAYYADKHETAPPSLALVQGDTHVDFVDPSVVKATFGAGGIVERTRPQHLIWHDLLDGNSCNPHHEEDPFAAIAKYYAGRSEVNAETKRAIDFVKTNTERSMLKTGQAVLSVLVASNHGDFLRRWIVKSDWKKLPPENRAFYLKTALMMAEGSRLTDRGIEYPDPFTAIFEAARVPHTRALHVGESFMLGDVELGFHGDNGPNGARGSIKNMRRVAVKTVIGHSHSPGEDEGAVQVGTSTRLTLDYNSAGPGSWLNTHCDLNADGKRQLITMIDGRFCI